MNKGTLQCFFTNDHVTNSPINRFVKLSARRFGKPATCQKRVCQTVLGVSGGGKARGALARWGRGDKPGGLPALLGSQGWRRSSARCGGGRQAGGRLWAPVGGVSSTCTCSPRFRKHTAEEERESVKTETHFRSIGRELRGGWRLQLCPSGTNFSPHLAVPSPTSPHPHLPTFPSPVLWRRFALVRGIWSGVSEAFSVFIWWELFVVWIILWSTESFFLAQFNRMASRERNRVERRTNERMNRRWTNERMHWTTRKRENKQNELLYCHQYWCTSHVYLYIDNRCVCVSINMASAIRREQKL